MRKRVVLWTLGLLTVAAVVGGLGFRWWLTDQTRPMPAGPKRYVRFERGTGALAAYRTLETRGIIRNASALQLYARFAKKRAGVSAGTYQLSPGQTADEILRALTQPVVLKFRIREGLWIKRVARRLEEAELCKAEDYESLTKKPELFKKELPFPVQAASLEGYLFPDTYEFEPQTGAETVIRRQLQAFRAKIAPILPKGADVRRILTVASLIEAEVADKDERRIVSGVIQNRLRKKMRLELDATVLYALQEWKQLGPGVVKTVNSPYNTYLNFGLPPGPICSPSLDSVKAAINPKANPYLFYVAKPDRKHLFAKTYSEHIANIRRARAMAAQP